VTTLTVSEIAKRIQEPGEALAVVVERLRNWTKEGLIRPTGKRNPGTGRRRRYPQRAVIDAAILSKLSLFFGIAAPKVVLFDGALDLVAGDVPTVIEHGRKGQTAFLVVGVAYSDDPKNPILLLSEIVYVDSAHRSFNERLPGRRIAHRLLGVPEGLEFGLVINLTNLFKRIGLSHGETANG
jgi:hypothetical protein